jgi:hypothetical protein
MSCNNNLYINYKYNYIYIYIMIIYIIFINTWNTTGIPRLKSIFSSTVTWLLKLITFHLYLNTRMTFTLVMTKKIQIILCQTMDE